MSKQIVYGFSDLTLDSDIELPKYTTITDSKGNSYDIECYFVEEFEEDEGGTWKDGLKEEYYSY